VILILLLPSSLFIFGNLRGKATGDLKISGKFSNLDYSGDIALKGFGLKLLFTGVDYSFDDTVIPLTKGLRFLTILRFMTEEPIQRKYFRCDSV
jgi:hypothetical protein